MYVFLYVFVWKCLKRKYCQAVLSECLCLDVNKDIIEVCCVCVSVCVCFVCVCLEVSKADILAGCSVSETTSLESRSGSSGVFAETQARIEIDEFHCKGGSARRISEYLRISVSICIYQD